MKCGTKVVRVVVIKTVARAHVATWVALSSVTCVALELVL